MTEEQKLKFANYILDWLKKEKFLKGNSKFIDLEQVEETCMASTIICEALAEAKLINEIGY